MLLILSAIIVACGILIDSIPIVIGGMLVTPLLVPILTLALGITLGDLKFLGRCLKVTLISITIIVISAAIFGFLFAGEVADNVFLSSMKPYLLYFIVVLTMGVAATFAWSHPSIAEALPGVAVAVSVVPPLVALGIGLSILNVEIIRNAFLVFIFNVLGIIAGSQFVFSLTRAYRDRAQREVKRQLLDEEKEVRK